MPIGGIFSYGRTHKKAFSVVLTAILLASILAVVPLLRVSPVPARAAHGGENGGETFTVTLEATALDDSVDVAIELSGSLMGGLVGQIQEGTVTIGGLEIDLTEFDEGGYGQVQLDTELIGTPLLIVQANYRGSMFSLTVVADVGEEMDGVSELTNIYGVAIYAMGEGGGPAMYGDPQALLDAREAGVSLITAVTFTGDFGEVEGFSVPQILSGTLTLHLEGSQTLKGEEYAVTVHLEADWTFNEAEMDPKKRFTYEVMATELTVMDGGIDVTLTIGGKKADQPPTIKLMLSEMGGQFSLAGTLYDEDGKKAGTLSGLNLNWEDGTMLLEEGGEVDVNIPKNPTIKLAKRVDLGIAKALTLKPALEGTISVEPSE